MGELKILFLEDLKSDFELAYNELKRNGLVFEWIRVDNRTDFIDALSGFNPNLVISDYLLPQFTGMEALKIVIEHTVKIPFIILTGSMNEETAVKCLKNGADDYVIKEFIGKLPYSVKEVLLQRELLNHKIQMEHNLYQSEENFRHSLENSPLGIRIVTQNGKTIYVNQVFLDIYEFLSLNEFLTTKAKDRYTDKSYHEHLTRKKIRKNGGDITEYEISIHRKYGKVRHVKVWRKEVIWNKEKHFQVINQDITDQKNAEEELLKFKLCIQRSFEAIFITDIKGDITYSNPAFEQIYGYDNNDVLGKTPRILKSGKHSPELYDFFWEKLLSKESVQGEIINKTKDGRFLTIEGFNTSILDSSENIIGFLGIHRNITDKKQAEEKILQLSRAVEQSPNSIIITDTNGNIEYVNQKTCELSGYSLEELLGVNPRIFSSGVHSKEFYNNLWETLTAGNVWSGDLYNKKKSNELYWEYSLISPIFDLTGNVSHYLAIKENITERKKLYEDLVLAKEKAEENDRLKSAFLANISHEIRTPMNSILGFTEILNDENLSSIELHKYLGVINKSGKRMLETINKIVEISRIESGQIPVRYEKTKVTAILDEIRDRFLEDATQKGLTFECCINPNILELFVNLDKAKIFNVLFNIVGNAIKFTSSGKVSFGCYKKNRALEFFVFDTGIGVESRFNNDIFNRFTQGSQSLSRGYEGVGLGLAISKAYIERLGGKIWFESSQETGSQFYFTVPISAKSDLPT